MAASLMRRSSLLLIASDAGALSLRVVWKQDHGLRHGYAQGHLRSSFSSGSGYGIELKKTIVRPRLGPLSLSATSPNWGSDRRRGLSWTASVVAAGQKHRLRNGVESARLWSSGRPRSSEGRHNGGQPSPSSAAPTSSTSPTPPSATPPPKKRRPIKEIRERILSTLTPHENIYTVPNFLTFSRLLAAPVVGYLVLHDQHVWALGLFAYAGITDLIDGYIARHWKLQTVVGTVIDPMADKTLMTVLTVCLAIKGALPIWLATIILGRDVCFGIAAIYYRWVSLPPPKTFKRYWDFSIPSAEVHPTTISKVNTALQLGLIGTCTAQPLIAMDISSFVTTFQYVVATTTVWSGASYIYTKDAVKILTPTTPPPPSSTAAMDGSIPTTPSSQANWKQETNQEQHHQHKEKKQ